MGQPPRVPVGTPEQSRHRAQPALQLASTGKQPHSAPELQESPRSWGRDDQAYTALSPAAIGRRAELIAFSLVRLAPASNGDFSAHPVHPVTVAGEHYRPAVCDLIGSSSCAREAVFHPPALVEINAGPGTGRRQVMREHRSP